MTFWDLVDKHWDDFRLMIIAGAVGLLMLAAGLSNFLSLFRVPQTPPKKEITTLQP